MQEVYYKSGTPHATINQGTALVALLMKKRGIALNLGLIGQTTPGNWPYSQSNYSDYQSNRHLIAQVSDDIKAIKAGTLAPPSAFDKDTWLNAAAKGDAGTIRQYIQDFGPGIVDSITNDKGQKALEIAKEAKYDAERNENGRTRAEIKPLESTIGILNNPANVLPPPAAKGTSATMQMRI